MLKVRHQQAVGRALAPAWLSRDHERARCCSPRLPTSPPSALRGAEPCSSALADISVPFPKGPRSGLLPHFPPEVLYSSFSGLNQTVPLSALCAGVWPPSFPFIESFAAWGLQLARGFHPLCFLANTLPLQGTVFSSQPLAAGLTTTAPPAFRASQSSETSQKDPPDSQARVPRCGGAHRLPFPPFSHLPCPS